jgi:hypothetical protein
VEIVLQNALHSQKGQITIRLREIMNMRLSDFSTFLEFKKFTAAAYSLWERAFQKMQDQHSLELTLQLIDCQYITVKGLSHGPHRTGLSNALLQLLRHIKSGSIILQICFMDCIEDVFEEQGLIKQCKKLMHIQVNVYGHKLAWMKHTITRDFFRGNTKTFQPFNRVCLALYNSLRWRFKCAELKRD